MTLAHRPFKLRLPSLPLLALAAALTLTACGGGVDPVDEADDHAEETIDTAGRLAISENGSTTLRLHDLDSNTIEASHTLDHVPSALYPSPGGRYAIAVHRTQDLVQFVDGGIWLYALDGSTATATDFTPEGWTTGRVRRAHAFDRSGQRFFVLDDQGTLVVSQWQSGAWTALVRVAGAIPTMPGAAPWPVITANGARDEIYITDLAAGQLAVVNSLTGAVVARRALGFTPSNAVWLGIAR